MYVYFIYFFNKTMLHNITHIVEKSPKNMHLHIFGFSSISERFKKSRLKIFVPMGEINQDIFRNSFSDSRIMFWFSE